MKKGITLFVENQIVKLITTIVAFSPIFNWVYEKWNTIYFKGMVAIDIFGLITSIITTLLLLLSFYISRLAYKSIQENNRVFSEYKFVAGLSQNYRISQNFQQELRLKIALNDEYRWVYKQMQINNNHITPNQIYKAMADYYQTYEENIINAIK